MGVEGPIFCRHKFNYTPRVSSNEITGLACVGPNVFMIQNYRKMVKTNKLDPEDERDYDNIVPTGGRIINFWISPFSPDFFVFSTLQNGLQHTMYMPPNKKRPDTIKDLKTKEVTSVAWVNKNTVIMGTADGDIWSCNFEDSVGFFGSITTMKHYTIKDESISGLVTCSLQPSVDSTKAKRLVLAATKQKLIHFIGPEISPETGLDKVFSNGCTGNQSNNFNAKKLILRIKCYIFQN